MNTPVAQWTEHQPSKLTVAGSNPAGRAIFESPMPSKYTQVERFHKLGENCHYCGAPFGGDPQRAKTRDHKQPLSRGGANSPDNIVAACYLCNHTKGNMTDLEFRAWISIGRPNKRDYLKAIGLLEGK